MRRPRSTAADAAPHDAHPRPDTIDAIRHDPLLERRLLRLRRLMRTLPAEGRSAYWHEARRLAGLGGDSGRLALVGFARQLPRPLTAASVEALRAVVREVRHPGKRALAFLALEEIAPLGLDDLHEAAADAERVPADVLRIMILVRLGRGPT